MTKRKFWLLMLVMTLVFGMTVIGCGGDEDPPPEEGKGTEVLISDTGGGVGLFYFKLATFNSPNAAWKSGITGTDVLSWLTITSEYNGETLTSAPDTVCEVTFTGLEVSDIDPSTSQPSLFTFTVSYSSYEDNINTASSSMLFPGQAIVTIKDDATTLSAIKAKTDGVEKLVLTASGKTAKKALKESE